MSIDHNDHNDNNATPAAPAPAAAPHAPPARRRRRWPWWLLGGVVVLFGALGSAGLWLWHSGPAQARLLQAVPGLSLEGLQGRATGGGFAVEQLRWQGAEMRVEVDGLQWQGLSWRWRPHAGAWVGLVLEQPQARAVRVVRQPSTPAPAKAPLRAPESLRLPLALTLRGLKMDSLQLDGQELFSALNADVELAADQGASHHLRQLRLSRGALQVKGELSIGADGELPVAARLAIVTPATAARAADPATPATPATPAAPPPAAQPLAWQAAVQATGPLRRLQVDADLKTEAGASLTAKATVAAFADWPLAALALQARDLDLSSLSGVAPGLPETALSGSAELGDVTRGEPLRLLLDFNNAKPGPWDTGRLPVRSAKGALQGLPSAPDRLVFDGWVVGLGRSAADGQLALSGTWQGAQLELQLQLQAVQARQLHTQAPATALDGTLALSLSGLAVPGSAASADPQPLAGSAKLALSGRLGKPLKVRSDIAFALPIDGSMSIAISALEASAGATRAMATLDARRDAAGAWAAKSSGKLDRVDLADWWPTAGRSDLNGEWRADLRLPAMSPAMSPAVPPAALLDALRGEAELALQRSQMSGVPVSATVSLKAGAQGLIVDAQLQAAGNRLQLKGRTDAAAPVSAGRQVWRAELAAPALQALAPLLARIPAAQGWLPQAGGLQGTASARGAWPALRSEGQLQISGLRLPQAKLDQGTLRWTFNGLTLDAPMSLDVEMSGMAQAERRIDRLTARLEGSLREHRLQLQADSPLRPPAWTDATIAGPAAPTAPTAPAAPAAPDATTTTAAPAAGSPAAGTALRLQAQGRWQPAATQAQGSLGAGEWKGRLTTLRAGPRAEGATPWLSARDLVATVTLDTQSQPTQALLAPGRIEAFGCALAWQQAHWQPPERPGGAPRITLQAQLEPLQVAPILARLQPEFGWRGDLVIAGRANVTSGARFDADISIERQGGDLSLSLGGERRKLELGTLRIALAAHDGQWVVSQAVIGQQVGVFGGSQSLQVAPDAVFPPAPTPLQGGFSLRVADAGIWAPWLPPGWRLGGQVAASLSLGGTVGSPTATGEVVGEGLHARNIFEGINLQNGSVRVALDSQQAVIETFRFQGGDGGTLDLQGRVNYAAAPQAELKLVLDKFRALDRVDRRVAISGNADIGLRAGRLSVRGSLGIAEGLIDVSADDAPSLSDDVVVVGRTDAQGRPIPTVNGAEAARQGTLAGTDIDLRLALGDALRLRGRGLDTRLRGQLRITTSDAGKLQVRGVVNTVDGTYTAYGQNLRIQRGSISFTGDAANPRLDILAVRADIDNAVGVIVSGFAVDPRVRLYSDPDLPEVEQLTWLLTGQVPQGQGRNESALLQRAALALLAGDRGASEEGFLQKLGLDQFGVGRSDGGDTVVTIGKQLSKRLSIVYEKGLSAAGGTWALLYRVAGRTTLRARAGLENSVEVIWSWRWD